MDESRVLALREQMKIAWPVGYNRLRSRATAYHSDLERGLIESGKLDREAIPKGNSMLHTKLVNYLRFQGDNRVGWNFSREVDLLSEQLDFQLAYDVLNNLFLDEVERVYPRRPKLKRACEEQRRTEVFLLEPEGIYAPFMDSER